MDFKMARTGNQNAHWDSTTGDSSDPGHIGSRDRKKKKVKALESQDLALPVARTIPHGSGGRSTSLSGVDISLQRYEHRCDAGITTSVKSIPSDQPARSIASASRGMIFAPRGKLDDIEVGPASYAEDMEVIELSNPTDSKTSVDNGTVTANSVKMSLGILPSWLRSTLSLSN
ncbi:hypothetical protein FRC03_003028 [Tulasnella sp. 419]|nr:hypothetical protein FRC03_003028 [Tulasnella sp. 419]